MLITGAILELTATVHGDGQDWQTHHAVVSVLQHKAGRLIANGFPGGFQALCRRCNASKGDGEHCRLGHGTA